MRFPKLLLQKNLKLLKFSLVISMTIFIILEACLGSTTGRCCAL